jgi:hypothetical protein
MFLISVVIAVLGVIGKIAAAGALTVYAFWLVLIAFVVLAVACLMRGV